MAVDYCGIRWDSLLGLGIDGGVSFCEEYLYLTDSGGRWGECNFSYTTSIFVSQVFCTI